MAKSKVKSLQNKAEKLWKIYCLMRDGDECQVKVHFSEIAVNHNEILQVDHCFSRSIKELFLDVCNGTVVCRTCNMIKGSGKIGASKKDAITVAIHEIVKKKYGQDTYNRMLEIASSMAVFPSWKNISYLEEQIQILEELIRELL